MCALVLALLCALPQPPKDLPEELPPPQVAIEGVYTFEMYAGVDAEGRTRLVECPLSIYSTPDHYLIVWHYPAGQARGKAIRDGNMLWCGWKGDGPQSYGVCCYKIEFKDNKPHLVGVQGTKEKLTWVGELKRRAVAPEEEK